MLEYVVYMHAYSAGRRRVLLVQSDVFVARPSAGRSATISDRRRRPGGPRATRRDDVRRTVPRLAAAAARDG